MKTQATIGLNRQRLGNLAHRQTRRASTHQQAKDFEAGFMSQRPQCSHSSYRFHISILIEMFLPMQLFC
jgi:hypothetical protein